MATRCTLVWRSVSMLLAALAVGLAAGSLGVEPSAAQVPPPGDDKEFDQRDQAKPDAEKPKEAARKVITTLGVERARDESRDWKFGVRDKPAATDEAQFEELQTELAQLEKQLQGLRDRLARIQALELSTPGLSFAIQPLRERLAKIREGASETLEPKKGDCKRQPELVEGANQLDNPPLGANSNGGQVGTIVKTPSTVRESAEAAVGGLHLDLVRLVEAYADAAGGVEIAKARLEQAIANDPSNTTAGRAEVKVQEITVRSAERKLASLRRIAEVVTSAAEDEAKSSEEDLNRLRQMYEKGFVSDGEVRRVMRQLQAARANLNALRAILVQ